MDARILTALEADQMQLANFLASAYSPSKSQFLTEHGAWWYKGDQNRWVLRVAGKMAGYCAVIPVSLYLKGDCVPAVWWVDLVIAPEYRGLGYQTLFDDRVRAIAELKLGFPNELAAKIHRKHGWGVRDDLQVRLLPFKLSHIHAIKSASGLRGKVLRAAAIAVSPVELIWTKRIKNYEPVTARLSNEVSAETLSRIFYRYVTKDMVTIDRNAQHIKWRYFLAPYASELGFYLAGPENLPSHFLIVRHLPASQKRFGVTRILDFFGDFRDEEAGIDLLKLAARDALSRGSVQLTMLASLPDIQKMALKAGFLARTPTRFCWYSRFAPQMDALDTPGIWTLGDSDHDEPG